MTMLTDKSSTAEKVVFPLITAIGLGCQFQSPLIGLQAAMPLKDMATSTATFGLLRLLGGTVGVAVGQAVYTSQLSKRLPLIPDLPPGTTPQILSQRVRVIQDLPPLTRHLLRHAFSRSISDIWVVCTPITGFAFILVLLMRKYTLKRAIVKSGHSGKRKNAIPEKEQDFEKDIDVEAQTSPTHEQSTTKTLPIASTANSPSPNDTRSLQSRSLNE